MALSSLPRIDSNTELKLIAQHPVAYPVLDSPLHTLLTKSPLLESAKILAFDLPCRSLPEPQAKVDSMGTNEICGQHTYLTASLPGACVAYSTEDKASNNDPRASTSEYFEPLRDFLRIDYWTSVPVTSSFAAGAVSLYLETDHHIIRIFDTQLFLNDLIHLRHDYCSSFLVNSLLAFASQGYCIKDESAAAKSFEFEKEAQLLWLAEHDDSLASLAGLMFLFSSIGSHGRGGKEALTYLSEAFDMAKRMRLFGIRDMLSVMHIASVTADMQRALKQVAWGVFHPANVSRKWAAIYISVCLLIDAAFVSRFILRLHFIMHPQCQYQRHRTIYALTKVPAVLYNARGASPLATKCSYICADCLVFFRRLL